MCVPGQPRVDAQSASDLPTAEMRLTADVGPSSAAEATAMARTALSWLADADMTVLTAAEEADCLRELERVESAHLAARSGVLAGFDAVCGFEDDGQGSARTWLKWQTRVTSGAAAGTVGWMRRLNAHPAVRDALAATNISASWARAICDWTNLLPADARDDADQILLSAAAAGAGLADLADLAEELRRRTARPDHDGDDDGFEDRSLRLDLHYHGAGKLGGDLTPQCAAAVQAVLDALGKRAGPADTRTQPQRNHDALEEACRRLIGSACLPNRAGQPTQIQLNMTLDQLIRLSAASPDGTGPGWTRQSWTSPDGTGFSSGSLGASGADGPRPGGWTGPGPAAGPGDDCDASIAPIVTGHIDHDLLDRLAASLLPGQLGNLNQHDQPGHPGHPGQPSQRGRTEPTDQPGSVKPPGVLGHETRAGRLGLDYARELILRQAVALLSGPAGLAARLRTGLLTGPAAAVSLPLDAGAVTDTIPSHLRRAVIARDRHCAYPGGCDQPPSACQVHHIIPRSQGGPTTLINLGLFCTFHHLIVIHRWGWTLILHADGTMTARSPDGSRTVRSHSPPAAA